MQEKNKNFGERKFSSLRNKSNLAESIPFGGFWTENLGYWSKNNIEVKIKQ